MRLSDDSKKRLLEKAQTVYLGYIGLDLFKTKPFKTDNTSATLHALVQDAIKNNQFKQKLIINEQVYTLSIKTEGANKYQVSLEKPLGSAKPSLKKINDYSDEEALAVFAAQHFSVQLNGDKCELSNALDEHFVIGGPGKIDIYRSHLLTLFSIIEKISTEDDLSNLLAALATGSGKTYVQALWMLVLAMAGMNGVFALPQKLIDQLKGDLALLLPDDFVQSLPVLKNGEDCAAAKAILESWAATGDKKPKIIIASSECLLDTEYQHLFDANPDETFLSFDEQHLLMNTERWRVRLMELSKKFLSLFLTATPNKDTYKLAGNKPVAILSSAQKQQSGQGQFPELFSQQAENVTDRSVFKNYQFWTRDFWVTVFERLLLMFGNSVQPDDSSSAVSLVADLRFYHYRKPGETSVRWWQVPIARKMLFIVDDNETLVNFCNALESEDISSVYKNGNFAERRGVATFFGLPEVDDMVICADRERKVAAYLEGLTEEERPIGEVLAQKSLKQQIKTNIFHNLMEYVLTDLTGMDEIQHNQLRKSDFEQFLKLVIEKRQLRSEEYYRKKLEQKIDPEGAEEIATLLAHLSEALCRMKTNANSLRGFVDNWALNDGIVDLLRNADATLDALFETYANNHLVISVMTGMAHAETPIEESKPFLGLASETYPLYENGVFSERAKIRQHSAIEILNDKSVETRFTPKYLPVSEKICDNYFRLGFVGCYLSNKKTEGFSDKNLHTVINFAESTLSKTNSPESLIQGIGRNRGLDETVVPAYIHALGRDQYSILDLNDLKKDDYYPDLFKSQETFNKQTVANLGKEVAANILEWFNANFDKDETIDEEKLKRQVLKFIAKSLRKLNNNNTHKIELSRGQLTKVISYAMSNIDTEIKRLKNPQSLPLFIRIMGSLLNFISEIFYMFKRLKGVSALKQQVSDEAHLEADTTYKKIIQESSFKGLIKDVIVGNEFKAWLLRKSVGAKTLLEKNISTYLNAETKEAFAQHQVVFFNALLTKYVVPARQAEVLLALQNMPDFIGFLKDNKALLDSVKVEGIDELAYKEKIQKLLNQVPGLTLSIDEIVHYPKRMAEEVAVFQSGQIALMKARPEVKEAVSVSLAAYIKGEFLRDAGALFFEADYQQLKTALSTEDNALKFVRHLLNGQESGTLDLKDHTKLIDECKSFFKLENFASLKTRSEEFKTCVEKDLPTFQTIKSLDDKVVSNMAEILQKKLLPSMVNVFPLKDRDTLMQGATLSELIALLKEEGQDLLTNMQTAKPTDAAILIFSKLHQAPLPEPLNIEQEAAGTQQWMQKSFQDLMAKSKFQLAKSKGFSVANWSGITNKPHYLYDKSVQALITSDEFLDRMSLLLPFNQWQQFKVAFKANQTASLAVSRDLLDKVVEGGGNADSVNPAFVLERINHHLKTSFVDAPTTAKNATDSLKKIKQSILEQPLTALSSEAKTNLVAIIRKKCLPMLAMFIRDQEKRTKLLQSLPTDEVLLTWFFDHKDAFPLLQTQEEGKTKRIIVDLLNHLVPADGVPFTAKEVIAPSRYEHFSEGRGNKIAKRAEIEVVLGVLGSDYVLGMVKQVYNPEDAALISAFLRDKKKARAFAKQLVKKGMQNLDFDDISAMLGTEETLEDVKPLNERALDFEALINKTVASQTGLIDSLDKDKVKVLLTDNLSPVLFHKKLIETFKSTMGFLTKNDLVTIFLSFDKTAKLAEQEADMVQRFLQVLETQDKNALADEFMQLPEQCRDLEELPMKKALDLIGDVIEEVLDCQCYFNGHDRKGKLSDLPPPKLQISDSLKEDQNRVESEPTFMNRFSRKIFFIQGIRNGLPHASGVSADSNEARIKQLERINNHILRPMWWGTNVSRISLAIIRFCRDVAYAIKSAWFAVVNACKAACNNWFGAHFTVSVRNPVSVDFNDTALDFAKCINEAPAFDAVRVAKEDCPEDTVCDLEKAIDSGSYRSGAFFQPKKAESADPILPEPELVPCP